MTSTDPSPRPRHAPAPAQLGPFDPEAWYLGTTVAEMFGVQWQSILNDRYGGRPTPRATRFGNRLYFKGEDLIAFLEARRER